MAAIVLAWLLVGHKVFCQGALDGATFRPGAASAVAEVQARVFTLLAGAAAITSLASIDKDSLRHDVVIKPGPGGALYVKRRARATAA